jgi:hypothetical protein
MLDTAVLIAKEYENAEFIIPNINDKEDSYIQNKIKIYQDKYNLKIQYQFIKIDHILKAFIVLYQMDH